MPRWQAWHLKRVNAEQFFRWSNGPFLKNNITSQKSTVSFVFSHSVPLFLNSSLVRHIKNMDFYASYLVLKTSPQSGHTVFPFPVLSRFVMTVLQKKIVKQKIEKEETDDNM